MPVAEKVNSISVFLIRNDGFTKFGDLVVDDITSDPIKIDDGELYYKTSGEDNYPPWVDRFFGTEKLGGNREKLKTKTLSAVYFTQITVEEEKITFAVAFGNGRYLIKKGCIQHGFGLKTSRHAIDASRINSVRTITYDSIIKDKTIRSIEDIRQSDFFLNANTDVLTAVSGKVRTDKTGELIRDRNIGGKDSVSISAYVDVRNLKEFLGQLYEQYVSDGSEGVKYESNIRPLETKAEISFAEQLLQKLLESYENEDTLFLNLPIENLGKKDKIISFTIEDVEYEELTKDIFRKYSTVQKLKETTVHIHGEEDDEWNIENTLFNFVYAEFEHEKHFFVLADGKFFSIVKGYKQSVETFYRNIKVETIADVTKWDGCSESDYNSSQKGESLLVLDEKFVFPEHRDRFEICDLLTHDKHIVHVKIFGGASQPLGHLFNQGMLSAQCMADDEIRPLIQDRIVSAQKSQGKSKDFSIESEFKPADYTVTFMILCSDKTKIESDGRPKIPFLAKAVLKENYGIINGLRFKVALACLEKS